MTPLKEKDLEELKVINKDSTIIRKLKDVDFNLVTMNVQSIIVHQGFLRDDTKIMVDYIEKVTNECIHLDTSIVSKLVGKKVFDSSYEEVGNLTKITPVGTTNVLNSMVVRMRRKAVRNSPTWLGR